MVVHRALGIRRGSGLVVFPLLLKPAGGLRLFFLVRRGGGFGAVALVDASEEEGGARGEEAEEGAEPFGFGGEEGG